jgi:uncharacterized membrane protein
MKVTRSRSFIKALTWRITGSIDTFIISWIITGSGKWAVGIASIEVFTKIILYYFHERVWNNIKWGRKNG